MNFTTSEDIGAPIEVVFGEVTDFAAFERAARRRGAEVRRTNTLPAPGIGMRWQASFLLRERRRELDLEVVAHDPPRAIALDLGSPAITGRMQVDLAALPEGRTRLTVALTLEAQGLAGRVMMQPIKLMRGNLTRRFRLRVAEFAIDVEDRFKSHA
ncbi:SRPBCC family protein [Roseovarius sp. D22-M7]|uniref:SRPBCC family protein n=1 Tax=Roseovarius sp. D22-M7 TaxID=3127116 RepID=UPI0030103D1E